LLRAPDITDASGKGFRDRAIMTLMVIQGLRVCEVERLKLENFRPEEGTDGALHLFGKGDKWRTVYLIPESRSAVDVWLKARDLMHVESQYVFIPLQWNRPHGDKLTRRGIRQAVDSYLEETGLKRAGVSCHSLRHSYATIALAFGADLYAISVSMGHSSITTTQIYAKIVDKMKHNPSALLGGLLE